MRHTLSHVCHAIVLTALFAGAGVGFAEDKPEPPVVQVDTQGEQSEVPAVERTSPPMSATDQALQAIVDQGRVQVAALVEQLTTSYDPTERIEIQQQIVQIKEQNRLNFLKASVQLARQAGDEARAVEAERLLDLLENPPAMEPADVQRAAPARASAQGGQR